MTKDFTYDEMLRAADKLFSDAEAVLDNPTDEQLAMILAALGRKQVGTGNISQTSTQNVGVAFTPVF